MPIVDRNTLYSYFETGDRPTESQFRDLIDSNFNLADDSISQGYVTHNISPEDDESLIAQIIPIPLVSSELLSTRIRLMIDQNGGASQDLSFLIYLYSDLEHPNVESSADISGSFFKNTLVSETITVPGGSSSQLIVDETFFIQQPLLYTNFRSLYVVTSVNNPFEWTGYQLITFEFN